MDEFLASQFFLPPWAEFLIVLGAVTVTSLLTAVGLVFFRKKRKRKHHHRRHRHFKNPTLAETKDPPEIRRENNPQRDAT